MNTQLKRKPAHLVGALVLAFSILAPLAVWAQESVPLPATPSLATPLALETVNGFDRLVALPYSASLDLASDFTQYAAFLSPAIFGLAAPVEDWLGIGVGYACSALLSFGARTGLKALVERPRPYCYFPNPPAAAIAEGEHLDSFPSGHSIMAFTGAGYAAALFAIRYPDSPYRWPATVAAYVLAGATAGLRLGSGSHFMSDVLVGAAIGTLFGVGVPLAADALGLLR